MSIRAIRCIIVLRRPGVSSRFPRGKARTGGITGRRPASDNLSCSCVPAPRRQQINTRFPFELDFIATVVWYNDAAFSGTNHSISTAAYFVHTYEWLGYRGYLVFHGKSLSTVSLSDGRLGSFVEDRISVINYIALRRRPWVNFRWFCRDIRRGN